MNKTYARTNFVNFPRTDTPLNEVNLNKIDYALDQVDDRVIDLDKTKATIVEVASTITNVEFDEKTGIITFTRKNGSKFTIDTLLEKIAVNFDYNAETQKIIITMEDGTTKEIDLSALITEYEFSDSETVDFTVGSDGKVTAIVPDGAITREKISPDYLAEIDAQVTLATSSASASQVAEQNAKESEKNAKLSETNAKTSEDNAKISETNAKTSEDNAKASEKVCKDAEDKVVDFLTGDTENNVLTFSSGDELDPSAFGSEPTLMQSKETHSSLMSKISMFVRNMRWVKKLIGGTDISDIADGTVTGSIHALKEQDTSVETELDTIGADISQLKADLTDIRSHIGMIIQSTTLDTEDKVKAIYGGVSWVKIEGRMLIGASSTYAVNSTGGEATHKLTVSEIPSHTHSMRGDYGASGNERYTPRETTASQTQYVKWNSNAMIGNTGGGQAHNNLPPYKAVYIWERTA